MTITEVGRARLRKEDAHLITGRSRYTDNMTLPGMLHLAMVRSPFAHAKITSIDTSAAKSSPGVVTVLTGADVAAEQGSLPNVWPVTAEQKAPAFPSIAVDEVAFAGEVVACIVARSAAAARDAVELVDVSYDELPVVLDLEEAFTDKVLAHSNLDSNLSATWVFDSGEAGTGKPIAEALANAEVLIERTFYQQRLIPAFMEPRSIVVDPTSEQITMWSSTQIPHILRLILALTLGLPESKLRVIAPDVGGGFGGKLTVIPEEFITLMAARRVGKPCKYTETRSESLQSGHHGRAQVQKVKLAATKDGMVTGLDIQLLADMGAYLGIIGSGVPILGAFMYNAIYKFPAYRLECNNLFTNKAWTGAYRGAGRPEATFAIERLMDELAVELGMDPLEVRKKNWINNEEFPFTTVTGLEYDSGNYEAATAKAVELFGYDELRAEQVRRREANDPVQLGIGISTFTEMCGLAPSRVLGALSYAAGGWEHAQVRVLPTGNVEVVTGTSPHGQGHETAWSQLVADRLGVPFENIEVLHGDTQVSQRGLDTYGSRSLTVGGMAVLAAADKVIEKAKVLAAHLMEASEEDIEFTDGKFSVKGTDQSTAFGEVAFAAFSAHNLPEGFEPNLDSDATFDPQSFSFPHGTHLAAMEVDTETGQVTIRKYVCVDDVGVVVNPLIVEGQVHGGLAQGIAQALYEEAVHDDAGTLVTGSFVDYLVPGAPDLPHFTTARTETPSTTNQLGAKGVGEAGTIASTPAIVNGVLDAVRHLGVKDIKMPCTPSRVWAALEEAKTTGGVQ
ncbi:xanthine dehydrogenase family protein molybdopterin-binding subunit [Arthrobacter sp. YA7-1]|uniref:xanthine dehydrogenase family protein molybdopterin-binding subunit n=1 Tax=Arthrobacter sp. YA7-1 TaxID=2987701 RepID=UPI002227B980|nr:xanthine dehydrogenase family protein molybdopterin-binding subunit [Arthrobacter sp. YA7-1]UYY81936.1 xanthine dehydrogenase family protein molybdopterin-binding subunit [Arthrobacter sp. YA7-1]